MVSFPTPVPSGEIDYHVRSTASLTRVAASHDNDFTSKIWDIFFREFGLGGEALGENIKHSHDGKAQAEAVGMLAYLYEERTGRRQDQLIN
jgi:hypothetical protein